MGISSSCVAKEYKIILICGLSLALFWSLYLIRLFFDVYVLGVSGFAVKGIISLSLGSSLPIAICSYILLHSKVLTQRLLDKQVWSIFSGTSIIFFL